MINRIFSITIITLLICSSCNSNDESTLPEGPIKGWSFVATVDGLDSITHAHLQSLFKTHGIACSIEGSVLYGVSVPSMDYDRAINILKGNIKKRLYKITIHARDGDMHCVIPDDLWVETFPNKKHSEMIAQYPKNSNIGAFLRIKEVEDAVPAFPFIKRMRILDREYLNSVGIAEKGVDIEVELAVHLDKEIGGKRMRYQVWSSGNDIEVISSGEWWNGDERTVKANRERYDKRSKNRGPFD